MFWSPSFDGMADLDAVFHSCHCVVHRNPALLLYVQVK